MFRHSPRRRGVAVSLKGDVQLLLLYRYMEPCAGVSVWVGTPPKRVVVRVGAAVGID
jgi:hypothetical protein